MTQEKGYYKRFACTGPGGRNCSCCYPARGKFRKMLDKIFKKAEKREAFKQMKEELC